MNSRRFRKGDYPQRLVLPDAGGGLVDLAHQSLAGNALALWIVHGSPDRAALAQLSAMLGDFEPVEARIFCVAVDNPSPGILDTFEAAGVPLLVDRDGQFAGSFGAGNDDVFVVLDGGARVVAALPDATAALAACTQLFHASAPSVVSRGAPVLLLEDVLEQAFCQELIDKWEAGQKVDDNIATTTSQQANSALKRRRDVYIDDRATYEAFAERLRMRVVPEIRRAFQVDMVSFEPPRIGCYDAATSGHFAPHRDNRTPYTAHRRFAVTINLNTGAYEGGQLRFAEFGRELYQAPTGGAAIFSCSLLHEALPVTAGRRFGVFSFLTDAAGARRERELIEAERAKGQSGMTLS